MPYLRWSYNPDLSLVGKVTEATNDEAEVAVRDCWATVVDDAESPPAPPDEQPLEGEGEGGDTVEDDGA